MKMKLYAFFAVFFFGCGVSTYQYDARYDAPRYGGGGGGYNSSYSTSSAGIAVPVSPMNMWGCAPELTLEIVNRLDWDAVVHVKRLIDDGTTAQTAVSVPHRESRILCLPDVGVMNITAEFYRFSHGAPLLLGCWSRQREFAPHVGYLGRHEFRMEGGIVPHSCN